MPRFMAPPPSGEFSIVVTKPFGATPPLEKIEFIGEPNRPATVKVTKRLGKEGQTLETKEGSISHDDVNPLLSEINQLNGFPTHPTEDVYGQDAHVVISTFELQWDNTEEVEGGAQPQSGPSDENKKTFEEVLGSLETLARQKAR